jgi:trk system potassium uptake protein TrkH
LSRAPGEPATSSPLPRPGEARTPNHAVLSWLVAGYLALTFAGFLVLRFGRVTESGHEMSSLRAAFLAVNASTLTGFQSTVGLEDLEEEGKLGPATVLVLIVGGALFSLIGGGLAAVRVLRMPYTDGQVVSAAVATLLIAVLAGATPLLGPDRRMFDAVFQATSAFANSGLYVGRLDGVLGIVPHAVLLPLAFVGGLGLPVLMELFDRVTGGAKGRPLSVHTRTVFFTSALLYLAGTIIYLALLSPRRMPEDAGDAARWQEALASSSAASLNSRTAGFAFEFAAGYPRTMQWVLMLFMAIGANPAGTGGGVKATTIAQLASGVRAALRGRAPSRPFGVAATWLCLYGAIVFAGLLLLLWRVPDMSADRLLFLSVSAASNVGLSQDPVSMTGPGLYTLSAVMLAGRVAPVLILWWMAGTTEDSVLAVG